MLRLSAAAVALGAASIMAAGDAPKEVAKDQPMPKSVYELTVKDIDGKDVALAKYKGDVCLIVNVASQ